MPKDELALVEALASAVVLASAQVWEVQVEKAQASGGPDPAVEVQGFRFQDLAFRHLGLSVLSLDRWVHHCPRCLSWNHLERCPSFQNPSGADELQVAHRGVGSLARFGSSADRNWDERRALASEVGVSSGCWATVDGGVVQLPVRVSERASPPDAPPWAELAWEEWVWAWRDEVVPPAGEGPFWPAAGSPEVSSSQRDES